MTYSITLQREIIPLTDNKFRLNVWVSSIEGFEEPGVFQMHRTRTLFNTAAPPIFETFSNPCSLVEDPYLKTTSNWGMYRDRELSLVFDSYRELEEFWEKMLERRDKLVSFMTALEQGVQGSGYSIGPVTVKNSSADSPYVRADFHCDQAIFMFARVNGPERFIGILGATPVSKYVKAVVNKKDLSIITYSPRFQLFMSALTEDILTGTAPLLASNSDHLKPLERINRFL